MIHEIVDNYKIRLSLVDKNDLLIIARKSYDSAEPKNTGSIHPDFQDFLKYSNGRLIGLEMHTVNGRECNTVITLGVDSAFYFNTDYFKKRESEGFERNNPLNLLKSIW